MYDPVSLERITQYYGVFYLDKIQQARIRNNAFKYNAAEIGTCFYIEDSSIWATENAYENVIAHQKGSVLYAYGDSIRQAWSGDSLTEAIGVAYAIEGASTAGTSLSLFNDLWVQNSASEDTGAFSLYQAGGVHLLGSTIFYENTSLVQMNASVLKAMFYSDSSLVGAVYDTSYINSRMQDSFNKYGAFRAVDSRFYGPQNYFELYDETF